MMAADGRVRFVLAGLGNVGSELVRSVLAVPDGTLEIAAVAARRQDAAEARLRALGVSVPVIVASAAPAYARVVVECTTFEAFRAVVEPPLAEGCHVIAVSVGALATNLDLIDLARRSGGTLHVASGAMPGLDILRAARESGLESVRLESGILPRSLAGERWIRTQGIDLEAAESGPVRVFEGSARDAANFFPRHFNVAVAVALAGAGLDRTHVIVDADGRLAGARHHLTIRSKAVELSLTACNRPSPDNPRTSRIVAPSIIAALRELAAPLRIGS